MKNFFNTTRQSCTHGNGWEKKLCVRWRLLLPPSLPLMSGCSGGSGRGRGLWGGVSKEEGGIERDLAHPGAVLLVEGRQHLLHQAGVGPDERVSLVVAQVGAVAVLPHLLHAQGGRQGQRVQHDGGQRAQEGVDAHVRVAVIPAQVGYVPALVGGHIVQTWPPHTGRHRQKIGYILFMQAYNSRCGKI